MVNRYACHRAVALALIILLPSFAFGFIPVGSIISIISPEPGSVVDGDNVLISWLFNSDNKTDVETPLRIAVNGVDLTRRAEMSQDSVTVRLLDLEPGVYRVELSTQSGESSRSLTDWVFRVAPRTKKKKEFKLPFSGNMNSQYTHDNINSKVRNVATFDGSINGYGDNVRWAGQVHLTSIGSQGLQPQNRYTAMFNFKRWTFKVGDINPRMSQFTVSGIRNRGLEINYRRSGFKLDFSVGNPLLAVEGSIRKVTALDHNGDTLRSVVRPDRDSTRTIITPGTYRRWLVALRPGYSHNKLGELNFNLLKVRDQVQSIDYGRSPKDNVVMGFDYSNRFFDRRLRFTTETAISLFNGNIRSGPMAAGAGAAELFIVVNQYFDPLPTDTSIAKKNVSNSELFGILFEELKSSALAHKTSLDFSLYQNDIRFDYKTVGRSYHSLGSPSVQTDVKGFAISDRVRLFDNKVSLNLSFDTYGNNVNGRKSKDETVSQKTFAGGFSYYSYSKLPNFNFNSRTYGRSNDGGVEYVTLPDGRLDSTGYKIDDFTNSYDVSVDKSFNYFGMDNSTSITYNISASRDKVTPDQASDMSSLAFSLSSMKGNRFSTGFSISQTNQSSMAKTSEVKYTNLGLRGRLMVMPEKLWFSGSFSTTATNGGLEITLEDTAMIYTGTTMSFSRTDLSFSVDYKPSRNNNFKVTISKAINSDDGYSEEWTWSDGWISQRTNNSDFPGYIEQNDFRFGLRYSLNF